MSIENPVAAADTSAPASSAFKSKLELDLDAGRVRVGPGGEP